MRPATRDGARVNSINLQELIEEPESGRFQIRLLVLLCCFMCVEGYDMQVVGFAAPAMIKAFHASKVAFGVVFSSALLGFVLGSFLIGNVDAVLGRKNVIIGGLLMFGILTLAVAAAASVRELILLRVLSGIGMGAAAPNAVALMADYGSMRRRIFFVCLLYLGYTGGASAAGVIAAQLVPDLGWRSVFVLGGCLSLAVAAVLALGLHESVKLMVLRAQQLGAPTPRRVVAILRRLRPDLAIRDDVRINIGGEEIRPGTPARHLFTEGRAFITLFLWIDGIGNNLTHYFLSSWLPTILATNGIGLSKAIFAGATLQLMGAAGSLFTGFAIDRFGPVALAVLLAVGVPCVAALGYVDHSALEHDFFR
jgi:MFS transporter, AAHS family, 4-hydroxybenzoate transporter